MLKLFLFSSSDFNSAAEVVGEYFFGELTVDGVDSASADATEFKAVFEHEHERFHGGTIRLVTKP